MLIYLMYLKLLWETYIWAGSLHPHQWACTYQYAVGLNAIKPFGHETPQSTCCGGTGVENHVNQILPPKALNWDGENDKLYRLHSGEKW